MLHSFMENPQRVLKTQELASHRALMPLIGLGEAI